MVDGGSLENCCAARHRGFESLFLRQMAAKNASNLLERVFLMPFGSARRRREGCREAESLEEEG